MDTKCEESPFKEENSETLENESKAEIPFKKPTVLVGKIGRLPRKLQTAPIFNQNPEITPDTPKGNEPTNPIEEAIKDDSNSIECEPETTPEKPLEANLTSPNQQQTENFLVLPYKEPSWSGMPESSGKPYIFEVLKNGIIIETIDLMTKPFWVFGRLVNCDICMQHPTISRYHAIIQYRDIPSEDDPPGFYVYDLGSTHGTFLNGKNNKLKPRVYAPIRVGHMLRLGCSQRSYILTGPEDDQEDESELSVTELKRARDQKIKEREEEIRQAELKREEKRKRDEEKGVDWGMGDDADDDEDIDDNPYASTNNEELYLDDPKKALRGFFEREGLDLDYDCTEQGMGQFLCKVELPLDDEMGRPIVAEVLHRGKKKEAVVQCALEACRILDRFGVLRQATHESKKRKSRNWEENDYYDSDEDTFLDRTGTIEKKREKRMKVREPEKVETYESLLQKEKDLSASIAQTQMKLGHAQAKLNESGSKTNTDEDSLDSYMKGLDEDKPDKQRISKWRLELVELRQNHANVVRLANIARPANLPPLVPTGSSPSTSGANNKHKLPIFGKRRPVPVKFPAKPPDDGSGNLEPLRRMKEVAEKESEEEDDENAQSEKDSDVLKLFEPEFPAGSSDSCYCNAVEPGITDRSSFSPSNGSKTNLQESETSNNNAANNNKTLGSYESTPEVITSGLQDKNLEKLFKIVQKLRKLIEEEGRANYSTNTIQAKKRKALGWLREIRNGRLQTSDGLAHKLSTEINRIFSEIAHVYHANSKLIDQVKQTAITLNSLSNDVDRDIKRLKGSCSKPPNEGTKTDDSTSKSEDPIPENGSGDPEKDSTEGDDKRRKKNQKRNEQRQHKMEMERRKGYEEDAARENYNMWIPPNDQSGDGRTDLNEKFGY